MQAEIYRELKRRLAAEELVALATVVSGPGTGRQLLISARGEALGELGDSELAAAAQAAVARLFRSFTSEPVACTTAGGEAVELFVEVHPPRRQLLIIGAVHVAIHLIELARPLGFRSVVVDPRTAFATRERFHHADVLLTDWPDEALATVDLHPNTFVAALSHDPKIDLPALVRVLAEPVRYVGALGSKKTHAKRVAALREAGVPEAAIARMHNPIGLDLGGRRAEEIAVAILAEMIAVDHGRA